MAITAAKCSVPILNVTLGAWATTAYTIELQPTGSAYPTGKINCTRVGSTFVYTPDSIPDAYTHYWVYIDGEDSGKQLAWASEPQFGGVP